MPITTRSEKQLGGACLIATLADVADIREPENDHSIEIPSVVVNVNAEQITDEPTLGAPFQGVKNGALAYTATFNVNEQMVADSVYRKFRDALLAGTPLVCYATMNDAAISATNEEWQFQFTPNASVFGWVPGTKRGGSYTFPVDGASVVINTTPPA